MQVDECVFRVCMVVGFGKETLKLLVNQERFSFQNVGRGKLEAGGWVMFTNSV